jgi:hypothetical protein
LSVQVWEWFPEFIAPFLAGISVVCLARKDNPWVTRIFGGSSSNEGMGFFSICLVSKLSIRNFSLWLSYLITLDYELTTVRLLLICTVGLG